MASQYPPWCACRCWMLRDVGVNGRVSSGDNSVAVLSALCILPKVAVNAWDSQDSLKVSYNDICS